MKQMTLCITRTALPAVLNGTLEIVDFNLMAVKDDQFHFINREVCDSKDLKSDAHQVGKILPQLLAYLVLTHKGKVLTYSRSKTGGEVDLHSKRSIGFGGHVDLKDTQHVQKLFYSVYVALEREIGEELGLDINFGDYFFEKAIIDLTNPVGQVHVGLPLIIELTDDQVAKIDPEADIADLRWVDQDTLYRDSLAYESWSKALIYTGVYK